MTEFGKLCRYVAQLGNRLTPEILVQRLHGSRQLLKRTLARLSFRLPPGVDEDDLLQELSWAVVRGYRSHDPVVSLERHLHFCLKKAMLDWLRSHDPLGRRRAEQVKVLDEAMQRLQQRLWRAPRENELARETGWNGEVVRSVLSAMETREIIYLDMLSDKLERPAFGVAPDPFAQTWSRDCMRKLKPALARLSPEQHRVITLHYSEGLSMREIAGKMKISKPTAARLHQQALLLLRAHFGFPSSPPGPPARESKKTRGTLPEPVRPDPNIPGTFPIWPPGWERLRGP